MASGSETLPPLSLASNAAAMGLIYGDKQLESLRDYLFSTGLADMLQSNNREAVTVLAPVNEAFNSSILTAYEYNQPRGVAHMRMLLEKHLYRGILNSTKLGKDSVISMFNNETLIVVDASDRIAFSPRLVQNESDVIDRHIADNGVSTKIQRPLVKCSSSAYL